MNFFVLYNHSYRKKIELVPLATDWSNLFFLLFQKNFRGSMCQFYEEMLETGYNRYRSVADESHYVGLNRKGRPLKGAAGKAAKRNKCLNFIKYNSYFNIAKHNDIVGRKSGSGHTSMNQSAIIADHLLRHHKLEGKRMKATTSTTTTLPPALLYPRLRHHHRAGWRQSLLV